MSTVSQAYVMGIGEGRAALDAGLRHGLTRAEVIEASIVSLTVLLTEGFGEEMRDCFRGQLDFFRRQKMQSKVEA